MRSSVVLGLILAVIAIALAGVWCLIPEEHEAKMWLRVPMRPKILMQLADPQRNELCHLRGTDYFRSDIILNYALAQPGVAELSCLKNVENKTGWLRENLRAGYVGLSGETVELKLSGAKPEELVRILRAVLAAYEDNVVSVQRDAEVRKRMELDALYKNLESLISRNLIQYKNISQQLGVTDIETARSVWASSRETGTKLEIQENQLEAQIAGETRRAKSLQERYVKVPADKQEEREAVELREEISKTLIGRDDFQRQLEAVMESRRQASASAEEFRQGIVVMEELRTEMDDMKKKYYQVGEQLDELMIPPDSAGDYGEVEVRRVVRWFGK